MENRDVAPMSWLRRMKLSGLIIWCACGVPVVCTAMTDGAMVAECRGLAWSVAQRGWL